MTQYTSSQSLRHFCWICYDLRKESEVPQENGFAVSCSKCNNWFCGFNHLICHICKKPEEQITIEDIFREITGNPNWGMQPIRLEVVSK